MQAQRAPPAVIGAASSFPPSLLQRASTPGRAPAGERISRPAAWSTSPQSSGANAPPSDPTTAQAADGVATARASLAGSRVRFDQAAPVAPAGSPASAEAIPAEDARRSAFSPLMTVSGEDLASRLAPDRGFNAARAAQMFSPQSGDLPAEDALHGFTRGAAADILGGAIPGGSRVLGLDQITTAAKPVLPVMDANPLRVSEPVARDLGLRDGEVVKGTVEADGSALKLVLKGLPIELPPGRGLVAGDTPTFRVIESPNGLLLQQVQVLPAAAPTAAPAAAAAALNAPAPVLPPTILSMLVHPLSSPALTQLFSGGLMAGALAAANVPELAALFRKARPSMARLTPDSLRGAVADSGLFAESALASGKLPQEYDIKQLLRRLLKTTAGNPAITDTVERAIEDIESSQLQAVQAQTQGDLMLNLVIPFVDANPVRLMFFRPAPSPEQPDPPYTVNVHSRNDVLGEVWLKTAITAKTQIDLTMWALLPEVAAAAGKASHALGQELEKAGLRMKSFVVYNSARRDPERDAAPPGSVINFQA